MSSKLLPKFQVSGRTPLVLAGTSIGVLDSTQPSRLLNSPNSRIWFANYHPRTSAAAGTGEVPPDQISLHPNRIVIETLSDGSSVWRPVPLAFGASSIVDEGSWPRLIYICGYLVNCSLEQWELHKLDDAYTCTVTPGGIPTITIKPAWNANYQAFPSVDVKGQGVQMDVDALTTPAPEELCSLEDTGEPLAPTSEEPPIAATSEEPPVPATSEEPPAPATSEDPPVPPNVIYNFKKCRRPKHPRRSMPYSGHSEGTPESPSTTPLITRVWRGMYGRIRAFRVKEDKEYEKELFGTARRSKTPTREDNVAVDDSHTDAPFAQAESTQGLERSDSIEDVTMRTATADSVSEEDLAATRRSERIRYREEQCAHWSSVPWDDELAIDRHLQLLAAFERGDRDRNAPLEEFEIPWPILRRPLSYNIQDIAREWVQSFYARVRELKRYSDISVSSLIKRSIKIFHEDKLIGRMKDVDGKDDRALVYRAAKVVFLELYDQLQRERESSIKIKQEEEEIQVKLEDED